MQEISRVIGDGRTSIRHSGRQVPATSQARQTAAEVSDRGSQRSPCKTEAEFLRPVQETVSFKRSSSYRAAKVPEHHHRSGLLVAVATKRLL